MLSILGLAILTRLPFILTGNHLTVPELNWMLVGEKLATGNHLYVGVWDSIGPLAALAYHLIEWVSDRNQLVYVLIATLLITHQALVFNSFLLNKKAYGESTYVPAFAYILLSCFSFDFYTLSPVLLSLTWLLLALRNLFYRIESQSKDTRILGTGIYLGIATLFYLPSGLFLISTLASYLLYASVSPRHLLLLLYGTVLPLLLAATYFFYFGALSPFLDQYLLYFQAIRYQPYTSLSAVLVISIIPMGFLIASLYKVFQQRYTNQQSKLQQVMLLNLAVAVIIVIMARERAAYHLLYLVPAIAFFVSYLLLMVKRFLLAELITTVFAVLVVLNGYAFLFGFFSSNKITEVATLLTQPTRYDELVKGKKTLILGNDINVYRHAYLATPYLNWQLSARQLEQTDYYENLTQVYVNFSNDMPEIIIDEASLMPQLGKRIPIIRQHYQQIPGQPVYIRQ